MDAFLFHGKIWQGRGRFADAMVIRRGRVTAVGREEELYPLAGGCEFISCQGRTVIPGLFDACVCLAAAGSPLLDRKAGLRESLPAWMAAHRREAKKGAYLCWRSGGDSLSPGELDSIWSAGPLVIEDVALQRAWANRQALRALERQGIPAKYWNEVTFGPEGKPVGSFSGKACRLAASVIPPPTQRELKEQVRNWLEKAARAGLTTIQSADLLADLRPQVFPVFRQVYRERRQLPRMQFLTPPEGWDGWRRPQALRRWPALGGRVIENRNLPRQNWQGGQLLVPIPHREALEELLECLRQRPLPPGNPRRLTLLDASGATADQLREMGECGLGVIAFPGRLGERLADCAAQPGASLENCCAYRTLGHLGARVAFGGLDRFDPFGSLQKAVCRKTVGPAGRDVPSREALTVEEGLAAWTTEGAWTDFSEDALGKIRNGYQADLLVLNQDVFTCPREELYKTRPVLTMAAGQTLWREI